MIFHNFDELIAHVKGKPTQARMAVAAAGDEHTLQAVLQARAEGIVTPVLVGDKAVIDRVLAELGESIPAEDIYDEPDLAEAARKAVALVREGKADFLISASMMYFPVSPLRLSLYTAFTFEGEPKWYIPTIYARQGLDYKIFSSHVFTIEFNQAMEVYQDFGDRKDEDQYMLTAQFRGSLNMWDYARLNLRFGYMLTTPLFDDIPHHYLQAGADTRLYVIPDATTFFLDLGFLSRFSVDGTGVPIYSADGFLTNYEPLNNGNKFMKTDSQTQGFNSPARQGYFVLLPLSFGYAFTAAPSFGELLMADYLELSIYCDLLFWDGIVPAYSTGLELQFELSLIGLQNVPMTIRVGYDSLENDIIWSLRFAVTK